MNEKELSKNKEEIVILDVELIDENPEHPFKVIDESLGELIESINKYGVTEPIIVVKNDEGRYTAVAGHRRKRACELSGIKKIPAIIRNLTREEAIIQMVDSNIHREVILPSEKAFAYKLKLEAMKHQGKTCGQLVHKSRDDISETESGRQISRYIRLTELIPDLLKLVDEGRIAFNPAVELSYLTRIEQEYVYDTIQCIDATPSYSQAQKMKKLSQNNKLTMEEIDNILSEEKPNQSLKYNLAIQRFSNYLPRNVVTPKEVEDYVLKCVIACKEKGIQIDKINIPLSKVKTKDKGAR